MTQGELIGLAGGLLGSVIGVLGGIVGTYASLKNVRSPAERRLMIWFAAGIWMALILFLGVPAVLAVLGVVPFWSPFVGMALFFPLTIGAIPLVNRQLDAIRKANPD